MADISIIEQYICWHTFRIALRHTETCKNMNLPHSIRTYWTSFWQLTVHAPQSILEKTHIDVGSSHICASFGTFCVQIGQLFEAQWVCEKCMKTVKSMFSKENDVDFEFFRKFKVSLRLDKLNNLDSKGAKRSKKSLTTPFWKSFLESYKIQMRIMAVKIRSVQCYGVNWIPFFWRHCNFFLKMQIIHGCFLHTVVKIRISKLNGC